eukprot:1332368-Amphidinium_carterae.1
MSENDGGGFAQSGGWDSSLVSQDESLKDNFEDDAELELALLESRLELEMDAERMAAIQQSYDDVIHAGAVDSSYDDERIIKAPQGPPDWYHHKACDKVPDHTTPTFSIAGESNLFCMS